ncbi:MAG: hypothetical protein M1840_008638 [Geoglossum simile]|nr:MAG: hypothetical protein M1840_008638 [Geoglossum simile]
MARGAQLLERRNEFGFAGRVSATLLGRDILRVESGRPLQSINHRLDLHPPTHQNRPGRKTHRPAYANLRTPRRGYFYRQNQRGYWNAHKIAMMDGGNRSEESWLAPEPLAGGILYSSQRQAGGCTGSPQLKTHQSTEGPGPSSQSKQEVKRNARNTPAPRHLGQSHRHGSRIVNLLCRQSPRRLSDCQPTLFLGEKIFSGFRIPRARALVAAKSCQNLGQKLADSCAPGAVDSSTAVALLEHEVKEAHLDLQIVERTLKSMRDLLPEGERLSNRHLEGGEPEKDGRLIPDKAKEAWKRFRWVSTDMIRLTQVVASLRAHNDELERIRPRGDTSSLGSDQTATACEAVATLSALGLSLPQSPKSIEQPELNQALSMIMHHEEVETTIVRNLDEDLGIKEYKDKITVFSGSPSGRQIASYIKGHNKFRTVLDVLIEWKPYGPTYEAQSLALERTDRVARLLSDPTVPEHLRVLNCVGYFQDAAGNRCGILFKLPPELSGKASDVAVVNLLQAYRSPQRPSLSARFHLAWTLAHSMLKFHLFRWLHKDFRSENIVFFRSKDQSIDIHSPYVAAFGLARPDQLFLASESNYDNDGEALTRALAYCHPDYRHSAETMKTEAGRKINRRRYHRAFDVYSLGCVLLEIGLWQSLESMNWPKYRDRRTEWQGKMIEYAGKSLGFLCGTAYRDIVVRCLSAEVEDTDRENERVRDFCWTIVRVLENLRV